MTAPSPTYDLVLLLDPQAEDAQRGKIVADIRDAVAAQGELVRHDEWGSRVLAYPIEHKGAAEYHLLQFHAATPELIAGLNRSLRITDGIVRYRINKLKPGTPEAPSFAGDRASAPPAQTPTAGPAQPAPAQAAAAQPASAPAAPAPVVPEPATAGHGAES